MALVFSHFCESSTSVVWESPCVLLNIYWLVLNIKVFSEVVRVWNADFLPDLLIGRFSVGWKFPLLNNLLEDLWTLFGCGKFSFCVVGCEGFYFTLCYLMNNYQNTKETVILSLLTIKTLKPGIYSIILSFCLITWFQS